MSNDIVSLQLPAELQEKRKTVIGASEVSALFGLHPRLTSFELALYKRGDLKEPDISDDEHVQAGIFLESSVANWVAYRASWDLRKAQEHLVHPTIPGLGATPDFYKIDNGEVTGPVEIKVISVFQRDGWKIFDDNVGLEAPESIEIQVQAQMGVMGKNWSAIGAYLGGKLVILERQIDPTAQQIIADAVGKFWATLARGETPDPQPDRDAAAIKRLYSKPTEGRILLADDAVYTKALMLEEAREKAKEAKEMSQAAEAELLLLIKDAEVIKLGDGRQITAKLQRRAAYSVPATEFRILRFGKARK